MPGRERAAADDGDSSEDEINVDQVIRTKVELGKVFFASLMHQFSTIDLILLIRFARTVRRSELK